MFNMQHWKWNLGLRFVYNKINWEKSIMNKIERLKQTYIGLSFLVAPLLLICGLITHPNLTSLEVMTTGEEFASEYRNNFLLELGHIAVLFSSLFFMGMFSGINQILKDRRPWIAFIIFVLGFFGSFMLGVDKGAFALVPSAFDTLSESEYQMLIPGFTAMINYKGAMWIAMLYVFIPISFLISGITLYRNNMVKKWQGITIILGALLFFNPDIDLISLFASVLILIGYFPMAHSFLKSGDIISCNC